LRSSRLATICEKWAKYKLGLSYQIDLISTFTNGFAQESLTAVSNTKYSVLIEGQIFQVLPLGISGINRGSKTNPNLVVHCDLLLRCGCADSKFWTTERPISIRQ